MKPLSSGIQKHQTLARHRLVEIGGQLSEIDPLIGVELQPALGVATGSPMGQRLACPTLAIVDYNSLIDIRWFLD
jgi:hypothetical protein